VLLEKVVLGLIQGTAFTLTSAERNAIRIVRDDNKCQDPNAAIVCGGRLEVDHILPQRFAKDALGMVDTEYDVPDNLLTRCKNHHIGHPDSHHPDTLEALTAYRGGDKDAFKKMAEARDQRLAEKKLCWNNNHDAEARVVARERTKKADEEHGLGWWKGPRWMPVGGFELEKLVIQSKATREINNLPLKVKRIMGSPIKARGGGYNGA
jgi:hypothetical protein